MYFMKKNLAGGVEGVWTQKQLRWSRREQLFT